MPSEKNSPKRNKRKGDIFRYKFRKDLPQKSKDERVKELRTKLLASNNNWNYFNLSTLNKQRKRSDARVLDTLVHNKINRVLEQKIYESPTLDFVLIERD